MDQLLLMGIGALAIAAIILVARDGKRLSDFNILLKAVLLRLECLEGLERDRQMSDRVDAIGHLKVGHRAWIRRLDAEACEGSAYVRREARPLYDEDVAIDRLGDYFLVRRTRDGLEMEIPDPRAHGGPIPMAAAHFLFDSERALRIENVQDIEPICDEPCTRDCRHPTEP